MCYGWPMNMAPNLLFGEPLDFVWKPAASYGNGAEALSGQATDVWSNSRMGLLRNILGRPGKSTTSSSTRPSIICSNSSNAANVSEPCYMSACSTHSSFASPLEREWGKPSPTRSWILYGNVREFRRLRGELSEASPFLLDCFLSNRDRHSRRKFEKMMQNCVYLWLQSVCAGDPLTVED